jgi:uncharacterized membrane-anchored protein
MLRLFKYSTSKVDPNAAKDAKVLHEYFIMQRIFLLLCLLLTTCLGGYATYTMLRYYENNAARLSFSSITDQMEKFSAASFHSKTAAMHSMRTFLKTKCPLPGDWPHCTVPIRDYDIFASSIVTMADITTCNHEPKILTSQIDDFVEYAFQFYNSSGYPDVAEIVAGGVYGVDDSGARFVVTEPSRRDNAVITPIIQIGQPREYVGALMFNLYSNEGQMESIDKELNCVKAYDYNTDPGITEYEIGRDCMVTSKIIHLVEDIEPRPAVAVRYPFLLEIEDESALSPEIRNNSIIIHLKDWTLLHVGSLTAVFHWDNMLEKAVFPSTQGLALEISDEEDTYTFTYRNGQAKMLTDAGLVKESQEHLNHKKTFPIVFLPNNDFTMTLSVHLDTKFTQTHYTNVPIYGCIATVIVISIILLQFVAYDYHVSKRTAEANSAKQKYIRYISHGESGLLACLHIMHWCTFEALLHGVIIDYICL